MPAAVRIVLIVVAIVAVIALLAVLAARRLRFMGVYVIPRTMFGPALVFTAQDDKGERVRVLNVGGMYQSATYVDDRYTDLVFEYYKLYDRMFEAPLPVRSVLMVGGGGYAYPKYLVAHFPETRIDVVEIDPKITMIARRHFYLDRLFEEYDLDETGRLGLMEGDGRAVLESLAQKGARYDAVLNDSFRGRDPAASMTTVEAARAVKACLVPGGLYLSNVVATLEGDDARFLRAVVATLRQVFQNVHVVPCDATDSFAEKDNVMVIATDGDYTLEGMRAVCTDANDPVLTDACNPIGELTRSLRRR